MDNGRYFAVKLPPGKHTFHSNDRQSGVELTTEAGQQYYIRVEMAVGFMKGHGRLILIPQDQGTYELRSANLKPLDAGKVADKARVSVDQVHFEPAPTAPKSAAVAPAPKPASVQPAVQAVSGATNSSGTGLQPVSVAGDQISLGEAARRARLKKAETATPGDGHPQN